MDDTDKVKTYIHQQLQYGLSANEIATQLRNAGWQEDAIQKAFQSIHQDLTPLPPAMGQNVAPQSVTQPVTTGRKRGRFTTAWLLLKISLRIVKMNKQLMRYPIISGLFSIVLVIVFIVACVLGRNTFLSPSVVGGQQSVKPIGYAFVLIYYICAYFIVNYYRVGLSANTLDLFDGKSQSYAYYMSKTRSKVKTIFVFACIAATVGMVLRYICERSRLLGRIVAYIIGALWSLATVFVDPVIVTTDDNALVAIRRSTSLFKSTWGENIIGRVSFSLIFFLIGLLVAVVSIILCLIGGAAIGAAGVIFFVVVYLVAIIMLTIVASAANGVLNTALFYYASRHQIPAAFDPELLNSVFVRRKRLRIFGKKSQA